MRAFPPFALVLSAAIAISPLIAADQPKFEEASVKRAEQCFLRSSVNPGRVSFIGIPLKVVLMEAFQVKIEQISGPSWLESDCVELIGKMPEGASKDQLPAMLQALLAERFKLAAHKETRLQSGYALLVDKNGPKLTEVDQRNAVRRARAGMVRFGGGPGLSSIKGDMTMAALAHLLRSQLGRPVQNLTGLGATYNVDLAWTPDTDLEKAGPFTSLGAPGAPTGPVAAKSGIFDAIRESLGLRLESRKIEVDIVIVDSIQRVPTEN